MPELGPIHNAVQNVEAPLIGPLQNVVHNDGGPKLDEDDDHQEMQVGFAKIIASPRKSSICKQKWTICSSVHLASRGKHFAPSVGTSTVNVPLEWEACFLLLQC